MEADTVLLMITIVGLNLTSTLATIGLLMGQMSGLRDRLDDLAERVARIEGYLMMSGGFVPLHAEPPPGSQPSAADQLPLGGQPSAAEQPPPAAAS